MTQDFTINQNTIKDDRIVELYTIIGKHQFVDQYNNPRLKTETSEVCAKKIISNKSTKFFIKTGIYGKIYDPIGLYSEGTGAKFLARAGKKAWEFKQVNAKVFEMYLSFLKTKNKAWLTNAERELN
jgi:hypothetical protein